MIMEKRKQEKAQEKKTEINTTDIIANLRAADGLMVKFTDFLLSVDFLSNPILWKVLMVLFILLMPLQAIVTIISTLTGIIYVAFGNITGLVVVIITVIYTLWLIKTTLYNPESDFRIADLRGWSKLWMIVVVITLFTSAMMNIWVTNIVFAISALVRSFIMITLTLYISPFISRYFYGVVIDGLDLHPDSKHNTSVRDFTA